jgi:hypothetical protein
MLHFAKAIATGTCPFEAECRRDFIAKYSGLFGKPEIAARIDRQVVTGCIKAVLISSI